MEFPICQPKVVQLPRNEKQTYLMNSRPQMWPMGLTLTITLTFEIWRSNMTWLWPQIFMDKFWNSCISEWEGQLTLDKGRGSRSFMTMTIWWPRSGVWIYQIVTGMTSFVGMPSTHLVSNIGVDIAQLETGISRMPVIYLITWSPPGANRTLVGPMLAPWTLLSGMMHRSEFGTITRHPVWHSLGQAIGCLD